MRTGVRLETICLLVGALALVSMARVEAADTPANPRQPSAIATEEVPTVPEKIFARLQQYQNMRSAVFLGWAPDGVGMLIATRFGNSPQLHRVYAAKGRREQITFLDEPVSGHFIPQAKDDGILMTMSAGGNEDYQILYLDRKRFRTELLTDGKSRNELGPVTDDGTRMIVHSNRRNGRDTDIYIADTRKPDSLQMLLETNSQFWIGQDFSPDGKKLLLFREVSINEAYPAILDIETKKLDLLALPAEGKAAVGAMAFAHDGKSVLLTTDATSEFLELMRLDLETKKYEPLSRSIPWDVTAIEVDPQSERVAFTVNADGASDLYLLEGNRPAKLEVPLGIVDNLDFSSDGTQLGFTLSRPDAPADAYSLQLSDGKVTRWTVSETGGVDPATFVKPERVQFTSFDGRQVPAYIFRPRTALPQRPVPVLINIHGGPEAQYRPEFSPTVQYYVTELGIAVIAPNVRGSAGYGKTYLKLDNGPLREDSVKDIGALLDWVGTQKDLDSSRVGVIGGSYGGFMVLSSLVHYPDRIKAGIDIVGIANFITFLERTSPYRQDLRRVEYGDERDPEMRKVFERINPTAGAEKIRSSLLVVHGRNDPRVPFSEAEQIAQRVRASGRPVWTVYADNEGHGFVKKDNRDFLSAVQTVFLEQNLVGQP